MESHTDAAGLGANTLRPPKLPTLNVWKKADFKTPDVVQRFAGFSAVTSARTTPLRDIPDWGRLFFSLKRFE
jgi:hypothetical protein